MNRPLFQNRLSEYPHEKPIDNKTAQFVGKKNYKHSVSDLIPAHFLFDLYFMRFVRISFRLLGSSWCFPISIVDSPYSSFRLKRAQKSYYCYISPAPQTIAVKYWRKQQYTRIANWIQKKTKWNCWFIREKRQHGVEKLFLFCFVSNLWLMFLSNVLFHT